MAIVTLRLNEEEEKILGLLVKYFDADKSKILKEAMWDKFEDLRDREIIEGYGKKKKSGKVQFASADDLIKKIENAKGPHSKADRTVEPRPSRLLQRQKARR
ncbi:MAG: DUF6290 family protein [Fibrobacterota bacterium]|nr:DUF6290 family protein [Fibrobacterota bacterium]